MADLTLTSANVLQTSGLATSVIASGIAGSAIAIGQPVYIDTGDSNKIKLCDANLSLLGATCAGVAITAASAAGQTVYYVKEDATFTHGLTTVAAGDVIYVSNTGGGVTKTYGDLTSSASYVTALGVCISATQMNLRIVKSGVLKA